MAAALRSGQPAERQDTPVALSVLCGTDLISIRRIIQAAERLGPPFLNRIWTATEQSECQPDDGPAGRSPAYWASLAARFAGKEAVAKALGTGIWRDGVNWTDIVISRTQESAPSVRLAGKALAVYRSLGGTSIAISLAHDADLATAFCVILADQELSGLS
jgi:holo-[acyl-carrier protein] synthase